MKRFRYTCRTMIRNTLLAFSLVGALCLTPAVAQSVTTAAPISGFEAASRLRAMPQRLSKLYLQTRLNVDRETSQLRLEEGIRQFDTMLAQLQRNRLEGSARRNLERLEGQWADMRNTLRQPPSDALSQRLGSEAEQLALGAQRLTLQLESPDESSANRLAELALRNDMLAQRLARLYMQLKAGVNTTSHYVDMEQTRKEFLTTLRELGSAPQSAGSASRNLELVRQQWSFFEQAVMERNWDERAVRNVATTSERISQVMNELAQSYRRAPGA
ncbi:hypothetical protein [Uliginosibacterium sp. H1]|uniref:hypothetical protein n=1 Tax=Uliginosibacterium sp. H1 TaxID=3114757 RepID=UPI002E1775CA|nr:hypothetical protein [Uliginosibacterium sp. H1]